MLHETFRSDRKPLIYGGVNLTQDILQRSVKKRPGRTLGWTTLLNFATLEISEAVKIQTCMVDAVKAGILTVADGRYQFFASGKNEDSDLIHFLFFRMNNWDIWTDW